MWPREMVAHRHNEKNGLKCHNLINNTIVRLVPWEAFSTLGEHVTIYSPEHIEELAYVAEIELLTDSAIVTHRFRRVQASNNRHTQIRERERERKRERLCIELVTV